MSDIIRAAVEQALGADHDKADAFINSLAERDLYLMHWPEQRSPKSMTLTSLTAAGPIRIEATDISLGVRLTIGAELTGVVLVANLPYGDAGQVGSWLVSRAVKAQLSVAGKNASPHPPGASIERSAG